MKKKLLALLLTVTMSTTILVGCGNKNSKEVTNAAKTEVNTTTETEKTDDVANESCRRENIKYLLLE